jgi:hypothetical protein
MFSLTHGERFYRIYITLMMVVRATGFREGEKMFPGTGWIFRAGVKGEEEQAKKVKREKIT